MDSINSRIAEELRCVRLGATGRAVVALSMKAPRCPSSPVTEKKATGSLDDIQLRHLKNACVTCGRTRRRTAHQHLART